MISQTQCTKQKNWQHFHPFTLNTSEKYSYKTANLSKIFTLNYVHVQDRQFFPLNFNFKKVILSNVLCITKLKIILKIRFLKGN